MWPLLPLSHDTETAQVEYLAGKIQFTWAGRESIYIYIYMGYEILNMKAIQTLITIYFC